MSILNQEEKDKIIESTATDIRWLGKIQKKRNNPFEENTVDKSELSVWEKEGWEKAPSRLRKKVKIIKPKPHDVAFENKCWALMYDLGFRQLNKDDQFILPYGSSVHEKQQIDVFAINDDVAIIIECKSSKSMSSTTTDHRPYIDTLQKKIDGFRKVISEIWGPRRVKFIFATNNQRLGPTNIKILDDANAFYMGTSVQDYLRNMITTYKLSAHYQFMGMLFKGEIINKNKIRIPAIKGKMGGNDYFMFSIEPEFLLKIGFVLHRVKANEESFPTYQRLLDKSRIKSLSEFINSGGYFPNSVILNFDTKNQKKIRQLEWEKSPQQDDSKSEHGILKIPNSYAISYIIDGQHRVYGYSYAESKYKTSQTIPVVAFENLKKERQLEMFMEINENQKAISRNLKETLKEDLYWTHDKNSLKIQAVMSGINNHLGSEKGGQISKFLSIGEDKKEITMGTVIDGIKDSGMLPEVKKEEMIDREGVVFKIGAQNILDEMKRTKKVVSEYIASAYDYIIDEYNDLWEIKGGLIRSSRGAYAFIRTLGELNHHLTIANKLKKDSSGSDRFTHSQVYIDALMTGLRITQEDEAKMLSIKKAYGGGNKKVWNHLFTSLINNKFQDFTTKDYEIFLETKDKEIQQEADDMVENIERIVRERTLNYVYAKTGGKKGFQKEYYNLFKQLRESAERAQMEYEKSFPKGKRAYEWDQMFDVVDYLKLWEGSWGVELKDHNIKRLSEVLSMRLDKEIIESGVSYYKCGTESNFKVGSKWLNRYKIIRNNSAHKASRGKGKGVNKEELKILKLMYNGLSRLS